MQTYYGVHLTVETGDALFAEFGSLRVRYKIGRPDIHVSLMHVCNQVTIPDCDFTPVSIDVSTYRWSILPTRAGNYLALEFDCPELDARHDSMVSLGAVPRFRTKRWHISANRRYAHDLPPAKLPTTPIVLERVFKDRARFTATPEGVL